MKPLYSDQFKIIYEYHSHHIYRKTFTAFLVADPVLLYTYEICIYVHR